MPTGSREGMMAMTDMTQWTEAELRREFSGGVSRDAGEVDSQEGREQRTVSTDRLSSSSGSTTPSPSLPSLSDGPSLEDRERKEEGVVEGEGEGERKRRKSAKALWKSVKKAGTELNQDTRKVFRYISHKIHSRHEPRKTKVKEVHILPGEENDGMWARRLAGSGSAHSGSSSSSDPST
ncbi:hypothetical protein ACOMHN_021749 [Nucella lapillus]